MGRYNAFIAPVECPFCGHVSDVEFQADIGVLEHHRYRRGDRIFWTQRLMQRSPVGPALGIDTADFWAYGVGICLHCKEELWAKIAIRSRRFESLSLSPRPEDTEAWGTL